MASQEDKTRHWVEDVFPPTFGYTAKELYERDVAEANNLDNEVELTKNFKDKSPSVYDIVARRYNPCIYNSGLFESEVVAMHLAEGIVSYFLHHMAGIKNC